MSLYPLSDGCRYFYTNACYTSSPFPPPSPPLPSLPSLSLFLSLYLRVSIPFFTVLVFSLSVSVSLSLISLLFFLPRPLLARSSLVELLSRCLFFSSSRTPSYSLPQKFSSSPVFLVASSFPNFIIFSCLKDERRELVYPSFSLSHHSSCNLSSSC